MASSDLELGKYEGSVGNSFSCCPGFSLVFYLRGSTSRVLVFDSRGRQGRKVGVQVRNFRTVKVGIGLTFLSVLVLAVAGCPG